MKCRLKNIDGVLDVHHIHIWSMDGCVHYATMHIIAEGEHLSLKYAVKEKLKEYGIVHATLEMEGVNEACSEKECRVDEVGTHRHHDHAH